MNYHISIWVISHNRIIITIRIHIEPDEVSIGIHVPSALRIRPHWGL